MQFPITNSLSDANSIITITCTPSTSTCFDIFNSSSANPTSPIHNHTVTTYNDELKHECLHMLPLNTSSQVTLITTPLPDKLEELPPTPHMDLMPSAPNLQAMQDTQPSSLFSLTPFASPADDSGHRKHHWWVDPGGSIFKAPRRCSNRICTGLANAQIQTPLLIWPIPQDHVHALHHIPICCPSLSLVIACSFSGQTLFISAKDN